MDKELAVCRGCGLKITKNHIDVAEIDSGMYAARFKCPKCGECAETLKCWHGRARAIADLINNLDARWFPSVKSDDLETKYKAALARNKELEDQLEQANEMIVNLTAQVQASL